MVGRLSGIVWRDCTPKISRKQGVCYNQFMRFQKGNILLTTFLVVFVIFFALGFGYFYWQKTTPKRINANIEPSPTSSLANPTAVPSSSFCQQDRIYVDLSECSCPLGTTKTVEVPQGGEEAVLICKTNKTQTTCQDDDFYAQQAMSFKYKVQDSSVVVSGCLADHSGSGCGEKTLNLAPAQGFYLASGKEQSVKVTLQKIENNKAYFLFEYGAAPPACETLGGCDYACEFIKE